MRSIEVPRTLALLTSLALALPSAAQESMPPVGEPERTVNPTTIRRKLNLAAFSHGGRTREVAHSIQSWWGRDTRFSENKFGNWIVANRGGIMVNGRPYDPLPGDGPFKVVMASDGNWIASTPDAFLHSGAYFDDPAQVEKVHADVYAFQTMAFGEAAPSRSPLRAGPRLPANGPTAFTAPRTFATSLLAPTSPDDGFRMETTDGGRSFSLVEDDPSLSLALEVDTEAPLVTRVVITRNPDDRIQRRSGFPPRFFVGQTAVEFEVLVNERLASPPRVEVEQADGTRVPASLSEDRNPFFRYRWFPFGSPSANGPARLEILGDTENDPPRFGADRAGNPIQPVEGFSVFSEGLVVDTLVPELRRTDQGDPGDFSLIPGQNEVIAGDAFPRSVLAFVEDYDQVQDPGGSGPFTTFDASGVDLRRIRDGSGAIDMKLFAPSGQEIRGTLATRISALELFLPDVYDPDVGVFPDTDGDGIADPEEGTYRVQLALVDEVGNSTSQTLPFGLDATPIPQSALRVSIRPVFSDPFPNPPDPLPQDGDVAVRRLERVEVTSPDPDFSFARSNVRVDSLVAGRFSVPQPLEGSQERQDAMLIFNISRDQDGDGVDDFENPAPGEFLPPGMVDPRFGRNDGLYRVVVEARDRAGNASTITRDITLDTTPPEIGSAFPMEATTQFGPLRIVDVVLEDPQARSGSDGSGIRLTASQASLRFRGNDETPSQTIRTLAFLHSPNPDDPTRPDFNPNDRFPKLLLEIVDEDGNVQSLPQDGSFDGVYEIDVVARDQAGNEAMGTTTFEYVGVAPMDETTDTGMPEPMRIALVRP